MALNRFFNPVPYEGELYAPPVDFIAKALDATQRRFDANFVEANALKNKYINARPQDRPRADEIQNEISSKIDGIVQKYSGDYSQATKDLYLLKSDIEKKLAPGTEGYTISENYRLYNEALKNERDRLAKGEITQQQFEALKNHIDTTYKGVAADPVTGAYNPTQIEPLATYVDSNKIVSEALDKLKPREQTRVTPKTNPATGQIELYKETVSAIDPMEGYQAIQDALMQDDKFQAYWDQINRLTGTDPKAAMQEVLYGYATSTIPARTGIFKQAQDLELHTNPLQLEELRFRNRVRFDQYKRKQDQAEMYDGTELSVLGTAATGPNMFKPISLEGSLTTGALPFIMGRTGKPNVDQILSSRSRGDVNYPLLKSIRAANPNMQSDDVLRIYNENVVKGDKYGTDIYYTKYATTKAQNEEADRLIPSLLTGQVPLYEYDTRTGRIRKIEEASERIKLATSWYDKDTRKANIKALGKSTIQSGHLPFGTILAPTGEKGGYFSSGTGGKYYVAADPGVKMNQLNFGLDGHGGIRKKAFGFIQDPTQDFGDTFDIQFADGSKVEVMGAKEYIYEPSSRQAIPQVRYYTVKRNGIGGWVPNYDDPLTENGRYLTPYDIEMLLIPPSEVVKRFPRNPISPSKESDVPLESY